MPKRKASEPVGGLREAWQGDRNPFGAWVESVSAAFSEEGLRLEEAARLLESTPAEIEAVLHLALLPDEERGILDGEPPPKSTWFLFSEADGEGIRAGRKALEERSHGVSAHDAVADAIRGVRGPDEQEQVAALLPDDFKHMAKKAKQYDRLRPRDRKALMDFARRKEGGRPLTLPQVAYAEGLLRSLAESGAVSRESYDSDQEICDRVLDALGIP